MSKNSYQKSSDIKKTSSHSKNKVKDSTSVITVRIDEELNSVIDKLKKKLGSSKADLIRNYRVH